MKKQSGFSMLEVLVSLLIIMIGALGMAGIQMLSISNTEIARYQSLAALLASSMAAEIQGNQKYWGTAPTGISVTGGAVSGGPSASSSCGSACTASQVAGNTLQTWATSIANVLPTANGSISCSNTPATCTVQLQWQENNVALNNAAGTGNYQFSGGQQSAQSYQTVVTVR